MEIEGNQQTYSKNTYRCSHIHTQTPAKFPHCTCVFHCRTRGGAWFLQEGTDVLLWPGEEKGPQAESRRGGRAAEETHRHHRKAPMEERCQRQCHHPSLCGCFLSWILWLTNLTDWFYNDNFYLSYSYSFFYEFNLWPLGLFRSPIYLIISF